MSADSNRSISTNGAVALASVLLAITTLASAETPASNEPAPAFETAWFLVQLDEPLGNRQSDGWYPLVTGRDSLDRLIVETGVWRIEPGLPLATRVPRDPQRLNRFGLDRVYRFFVPVGCDIPSIVERFSRVDGVGYAEPDFLMALAALTPDDPRFPDQWSLDQTSDADIDAPEAWGINVGARQIIGMNDSGVDSDHEDLSGKILPGWDFVNNDPDPEDDNGHGTRTTSIAMAGTNNGVGIAGVCWDCRILPSKVFNALGQGSHARSADGYVWLTDHGARIINQSGGGPVPSQTLHNGILYAYDAGVVMASGTGNKNSTAINYPAAYPEVIAAGGTDQQDQRASFSNYGSQIDVVAPAVAILTAQIGGGYSTANGNSFAGPHVSGLLGLMRSIYPAFGRDEARYLVYAGAEDQVGRPAEDTPGWDQYHGWGRINAERTLEATRSSISLRVVGTSATRLYHERVNPLAESYDFVRGDLSAISETGDGVALGSVVCLEDDSLDSDTAGGNEDEAAPSPGEGFFYVSRFRAAPGAGEYGGSSGNRDRQASAGDCAP